MKKELNSAPIMAREQWTVMLGENSGLLRLSGLVMPVCVCKMDTSNFISRQLTGKQMKNKVIRLLRGCYPSWLLRLFCFLNKVEIRFAGLKRISTRSLLRRLFCLEIKFLKKINNMQRQLKNLMGIMETVNHYKNRVKLQNLSRGRNNMKRQLKNLRAR